MHTRSPSRLLHAQRRDSVDLDFGVAVESLESAALHKTVQRQHAPAAAAAAAAASGDLLINKKGECVGIDGIASARKAALHETASPPQLLLYAGGGSPTSSTVSTGPTPAFYTPATSTAGPTPTFYTPDETPEQPEPSSTPPPGRDREGEHGSVAWRANASGVRKRSESGSAKRMARQSQHGIAGIQGVFAEAVGKLWHVSPNGTRTRGDQDEKANRVAREQPDTSRRASKV